MRKLIGLVLLTTTALTFAEPSMDSTKLQKLSDELQKRFAAADVDHDGKLTREEAKGKMPRVYKNFDAIDAEKTGYVTIEQISQFAETKFAEHQAKNGQ